MKKTTNQPRMTAADKRRAAAHAPFLGPLSPPATSTTIRADGYVAIGEGVTRDATGSCYVHFPVYCDPDGQWWCSHPTDPKGRDVKYDGKVRNSKML